jgi:hypothetical protein
MPNYLGVATDEPILVTLKFTSLPSSVIKAMARISQSLTPVSVGGATCAEQNFTVTGLAVGDFVDVTPPAITAGVAPVTARVSAINTLTVTFCNPTAGALTPAAGVYQIQVTR